METASVFADAIGHSRGGFLRGIVERVADTLASRSERRHVLERRNTNWQEMFGSNRQIVLSNRHPRRVNGMEQSELWSDEAVEERFEEHHEAVAVQPVQLVERPMSSVYGRDLERVTRAAMVEIKTQTRVASMARPAASPAPRTNRKADVARYLQAAGSVEGIDAARVHFDLPRGSFSATFNLWKGAPVGTRFLNGC